LTKIIKQRIKKKKEILKIKNVRFNDYSKIAKISNKFKHIIENVTIKDNLLIIYSNFRVIQY